MTAPRRPAASKPARSRDADATKARILVAARAEFARLGLAGARVDAIAARAKANKRMIYHYFKDKDDLFRAVLEDAYGDIRAAEAKLDLDAMDPEAALSAFVAFTWSYYLRNPAFLALVRSANLHKGRHFRGSKRIETMHEGFLPLIGRILDRGVAAGCFRAGVDPMQLHITIAAVSFYYLTNRYTGSVVYRTDLAAPGALEARLAFNVETVLRIVRTSAAGTTSP